MKFRQRAFAAVFAAVTGLSIAAASVTASAETLPGYAPTVQEMLKGRQGTVSPVMPAAPSSTQTGTVKPKVGMDPVYSSPKKKVKKKAKKKTPDCPPGMVVQDNGCVEQVVTEETLPPEQQAAPAAAVPAMEAPVEQPSLAAPAPAETPNPTIVTPVDPSPYNAMPSPAPADPAVPDCPAGMTRDAGGNCASLPADVTTPVAPAPAPEQGALPAPAVPAPAMAEDTLDMPAPDLQSPDMPQAQQPLADIPAPAPAPTDIPAGMPVPCPEGQIWNAAISACAPM